MKEYGGYLPLELPQRTEYFSDFEKQRVLRLSCGRAAFYCAACAMKPKKIYVPYLNCANSTDPFDIAKIPYEFYRLDNDLTPLNVSLEPEEAILWINYYGNATEDQKKKVLKKYDKLMIDNCQAFFSEPILKDNVFNCYSTRKFFGVSDGAYLIAENLPAFDLKESESAEESLFLMQTIERGTNALYNINLKNEQRLSHSIEQMSKLTRRILSSIDYQGIQRIRYRNFCVLHSRLKQLNEFSVNAVSKTHMYYPLLIQNDNLRAKLVENRIYTPTWWRHVPELCGNSGIETLLSRYMMMIPIDQRYDDTDMDDIADIIMRNL